MDLADEALHVLADGFDHGAAEVVTLATTAGAAVLWRRVKATLTRRNPVLSADEQAVLAAEPGDQVDRQVLRSLLLMVPPLQLSANLTMNGNYVARDHIEVRGDYVKGDKTEFHFGNS
jgi:hypothetical protein